MEKQNRTRSTQLIFRVTPEEKEKIYNKMEKANIKNFNAYARLMLLDGQVIQTDLSYYHELANEINKIGINVNQIARVSNQNQNINQTEIDELKEKIEQIWQLLKYSLSKIHSNKQ